MIAFTNTLKAFNTESFNEIFCNEVKSLSVNQLCLQMFLQQSSVALGDT